MTTGTLIEILKNFPPETKILLSEDPEGNDFHLLTDCYLYNCVEDNGWHDGWAPVDDDDVVEYDDDKVQKMVILWP